MKWIYKKCSECYKETGVPEEELKTKPSWTCKHCNHENSLIIGTSPNIIIGGYTQAERNMSSDFKYMLNKVMGQKGANPNRRFG